MNATSTSVTLDRPRSDRQIAGAVARALRIEPGDVLVVGDLREVPDPIPANLKAVCERESITGDFALQVVIYPQAHDIAAMLDGSGSEDVYRRICRGLGVNCLLEGPGPNPYEALYLPLEGEPRLVLLDADALDNDQAFILSRQPAQTP